MNRPRHDLDPDPREPPALCATPLGFGARVKTVVQATEALIRDAVLSFFSEMEFWLLTSCP